MSWLNATNTENGLNAEHWLRWAEIQSETIDESLIDLACDKGNFTETQVQEVQKFDKIPGAKSHKDLEAQNPQSR